MRRSGGSKDRKAEKDVWTYMSKVCTVERCRKQAISRHIVGVVTSATLVVVGATLVVTGALLVVTRSKDYNLIPRHVCSQVEPQVLTRIKLNP